ncbi:MAG: glycosyltransferase family 2 protein [Candidatus Omnitrophota bacterium]
MSDTKPMLSVILPAFNEKNNLLLLIPKIIEVISKRYVDYEVVLVDDGSNDGTREAIYGLRERFPKVKYIGFKQNRGLSTALAAGYEISQGEIIVTMDSDLQYDPQDIPRLVEKLDVCELVCGFRRSRHDRFFKKVSSKIANNIRRAIIKDAVNDSGCIFRAFRRGSCEDIKLFRGFHRFLPALFKSKGFKVVEIDVKHFPRKYGRSKYNVRNRLFVTFIDLLMLKWFEARKIDYEISEKIL